MFSLFYLYIVRNDNNKDDKIMQYCSSVTRQSL